ncbi:hypothetical protein [Novosphingobium taihuense]|uniref:DUF4402 domain-containing protein n=1 Tax=Novosphingobium taihuense TaxID=260085 RepID=A0A7W7EU45_9SPHN|nr:hypothetical protein [Novosphingobium taihuense]MBB4613561.1 hypothetical protein [Novosphingobium taihuense]TWH81195.1 hypothetical protein IQ25_03582 [Novosphingobium taihuense]
MKADLLRSPLILLPMLGIAVPAAAQEGPSDTARGQVAVSGSVARLCILGEPSRAVIDIGQMVQTSGASVGRIAALSAQSVTLPGSFCNFAGSVLGVTASALVDGSGAAPPAGFARAVNYTATASGWGSGDAEATTSAAFDGTNPDASGSGTTQPEPKLGDVDVSLSSFTAPGNALLVAGNYTGLVTVTLGPVPVSE